MTVSNIHRVIGDCLYGFYYSFGFMFKPELEVELLLSGLELYEGVLPFDEKNYSIDFRKNKKPSLQAPALKLNAAV